MKIFAVLIVGLALLVFQNCASDQSLLEDTASGESSDEISGKNLKNEEDVCHLEGEDSDSTFCTFAIIPPYIEIHYEDSSISLGAAKDGCRRNIIDLCERGREFEDLIKGLAINECLVKSNCSFENFFSLSCFYIGFFLYCFHLKGLLFLVPLKYFLDWLFGLNFP